MWFATNFAKSLRTPLLIEHLRATASEDKKTIGCMNWIYGLDALAGIFNYPHLRVL